MKRVLLDEVVEHVRNEMRDRFGGIDGKQNARHFVRALFKEVGEIVANGNAVNVPGFGIFKPATRKPRRIRNPANGELMRLPRTRSIRLQPAKAQRAWR